MICKTCSLDKSHEHFYTTNKSTCKDCIKSRAKSQQKPISETEKLKRKERYRDRYKGKYYDSDTAREQYLTNKDEITRKRKEFAKENPEKYLLRLAVNRSKKNNIQCTITESDIHIPTHCPILGIELTICGEGLSDSSASIDKIIPELGYIPGNIQVVSLLANKMKSSASLDQLVMFSTWVIDNLKHSVG